MCSVDLAARCVALSKQTLQAGKRVTLTGYGKHLVKLSVAQAQKMELMPAVPGLEMLGCAVSKGFAGRGGQGESPKAGSSRVRKAN